MSGEATDVDTVGGDGARGGVVQAGQVEAPAASATLGAMAILHVRPKAGTSPDSTLRAWVRKGASAKAATDVAAYIDADLSRVFRVVGLSERTVARKRKEGKRLGVAPSDRLARIARITALAEGVLGGREAAGRWLTKPNRVLGAAPLDLLDTDIGTEQVEDVLGRIEHGVYS